MTPQTTPDITPPPFLVEGATVRFDASRRPARGHEQDWRLSRAEQHDWQVTAVKTDQRRFDEAPRLYVTLRSLSKTLAYMTLPYDPNIMQVTPPPPKPPKPQVLFPEPGSEVYIRESDDPSRPSFRDGLWEVRNAFHKVAEDGGDRQELHLSLKSVGRKNQSYVNIAFNAATMTPVIPDYAQAPEFHCTAQRDVGVFKPLAIKKRNATP